MIKSLYLVCAIAFASVLGGVELKAETAHHGEHVAHEVSSEHADHSVAGHGESHDAHGAAHGEHAEGDHGDHGHGGHHEDLPAFAERVHKVFGFPITNSMIQSWVVALVIIVFAQVATRKMAIIPSGLQNFAEFIVESLYDFLLTILGDEKLLKRTFWFFGGVFLLILTNNWAGLLPGVGTVGWHISGSEAAEVHGISDNFRPFFRGANADLNMTAAMSALFAFLWFVWAISENGLKGFFAHIFAPKGLKGGLAIALAPIFFLVGVLEMVSIGIRPVALSFRLFGNIYGGEVTLEKLMNMVPQGIAFAPALPFMFMELLVGFVQALVYMLLCAVFLRLICDHGDEHAH